MPRGHDDLAFGDGRVGRRERRCGLRAEVLGAATTTLLAPRPLVRATGTAAVEAAGTTTAAGTTAGATATTGRTATVEATAGDRRAPPPPRRTTAVEAAGPPDRRHHRGGPPVRPTGRGRTCAGPGRGRREPLTGRRRDRSCRSELRSGLGGGGGRRLGGRCRAARPWSARASARRGRGGEPELRGRGGRGRASGRGRRRGGRRRRRRPAGRADATGRTHDAVRRARLGSGSGATAGAASVATAGGGGDGRARAARACPGRGRRWSRPASAWARRRWARRAGSRLSASRRTRSADGSSMLDEWLFTPILSSSESSRTTWLSTPSSRASS